VALAERFGPLESIFLSNICWWVETNRKNQKHFYEGRYWTYGSADAFRRIFTYLSPQQIRRIIDTLREKKALLTGNFNRSGYDRTLWYTASDEVLALYEAKNPEQSDPEPEPAPEEPEAGDEAAPEAGNEAENRGPEPALEAPSPGDDTEGENSHLHLLNSTNANGENPIPIDRIRSMDLPNSINGFAEFDPPIPLLKDIKPSAAAPAPPPAGIPPQKAAAAVFQEECKALFVQIHPALTFSDDFYPRAEEILQKTGPGYPEWIYRECLLRSPQNLRGLFYRLFLETDMTAAYQNKHKTLAGEAADPLCPACGKQHSKILGACPGCGLDVKEYGNPRAVKKQKKINAMPQTVRALYDQEILQIVHKIALQKFHDDAGGPEITEDQWLEIDRKYHLIE
jgi:hypothetical protein